MKLYGLYLAEADEGQGGPTESGISKILKAAFAGIGKALLFLAAIIVHGLLGKAVIAGEVSAKDAIKAGRLNREKRFREFLRNRRREAIPEEIQLKEVAELLEKKFQDIVGEIGELGDAGLSQRLKLLIAKFVDDDSSEGSGSFGNLAGSADNAGAKAWQTKILFMKKMIIEAQKMLKGATTAATTDKPDKPDETPEELAELGDGGDGGGDGDGGSARDVDVSDW